VLVESMFNMYTMIILQRGFSHVCLHVDIQMCKWLHQVHCIPHGPENPSHCKIGTAEALCRVPAAYTLYKILTRQIHER
jgi:hypothetical protein